MEINMSDKIQHLNEQNFQEYIKSNTGLVLVDIWATWCGPCKAIAPILDKIADEMSEVVKIAKIDADTNQNLVSQFGVRGIPTLIMFKDGLEINRHIGSLNHGQLKALIEQHA